MGASITRELGGVDFRVVLGSVFTAIVTPFWGRTGAVDFEVFQQLAAHLVDNGSDGIVVAGTTGESPTLSDGERLDLFRAAIESVGERATVVAGTGTCSTAHSIKLGREQAAPSSASSGLLVVTPYYNKPPQAGIVAHFEAIAEATDLPIVVYNIPARVVGEHRAGHDFAARRDRDRESGQAGECRPRPGAAYRRDGPRPLRRRRQPHPAVPGAGRSGRSVRPHACRRPAGGRTGAGRAGRRHRPRTRDRQVVGAGVRAPRRGVEPDRHQGRAPAPRSSGRRAPPAARGRKRRRSWRAFGTASSASVCSSAST